MLLAREWHRGVGEVVAVKLGEKEGGRWYDGVCSRSRELWWGLERGWVAYGDVWGEGVERQVE